MTELNANKFNGHVGFYKAVEYFRKNVWPNLYPGQSLPEAYFWSDFSVWLMSPAGRYAGKITKDKKFIPFNGNVLKHGWSYYENDSYFNDYYRKCEQADIDSENANEHHE